MMASLVKAVPKGFYPVLSFLLALLFSTTDLIAQAESGESAPPAHPYVGLDIGLGALPSSIIGGCSGYSAEEGGPEASPFGGLFFGLPIGPFHLESRTHRWSEDIRQACATLGNYLESGIHTKYTPRLDHLPKYSSDLRIRYGLPFQPSLVASVGGGWLWGTDVPFVSSGLGIRRRGKNRFTLDLAWEMHRIPYLLSDEEWEDGQLLRVVGERKEHDWQRGWLIQIGWARYIR